MKKLLLLLLFNCMPVFTQKLFIYNGSKWPIDVKYTDKQGTSEQIITIEPGEKEQIYRDLFSYKNITIEGHGKLWSYASPSKFISLELEAFVDLHKSELKPTSTQKKDVLATITAVPVSLSLPRGDWAVSFKLVGGGSSALPNEVTLEDLSKNVALFFPRLAGAKSFDSRLMLNIPSGHTPTRLELDDKKLLLDQKLKAITDPKSGDTAETKGLKAIVKLNVNTQINKAYDDLMDRYGYSKSKSSK